MSLSSPHLGSRWWLVAAAVAFLAHASLYLYYFVDDEGITLVYARNLLDGHGLSYAPSEGPAEGYSNFLHVILMAGVLRVIRAAGLDPMAAFVAGGLVSTLCGAALVALVWLVGGRFGWPLAARVTATFLLALSGPFAVWSNSSLETVAFALAFMALVAATVPAIHPRAAALAAIVVLLMRIDGALFVGVWIAARFLAGDHAERRTILTEVAVPVLAAGVLSVAARAWYFGSWLPLPLQTKVAHKLVNASAAVVWSNRSRYLLSFAAGPGWPLLLGVAALPLVMWRAPRAQPAIRFAGLATTALVAYAAFVGDWMFGFRFFVPLLAPLALLCGAVLAILHARRPGAAFAVAIGVVLWAASGAVMFERSYEKAQHKIAFWKAPSLDPARRFGEYYEAYRALQPLVTPGMRIAYHEAGFVPFLLDVENIDMLGLTSPFIAGAPTEDAIFTDVGRYYPLTPEPPHHAVHAYLVYRQAALIIVRKNWMRTANGGAVPGEILRGYYAVARETRSFVIYRRTAQPTNPERVQADGFLENLAHPAYAQRVAVNGIRLPPDRVATDLPSLWQGGSHPITLNPAWTLHSDLREVSPVHELYLDGTTPEHDVSIDVHLVAASRESVHALQHTVRAGEPLRMRRHLEVPHPTDTIEIRLTSVSGTPVQLRLRAVRVMGQTAALREHVLRHGIR